MELSHFRGTTRLMASAPCNSIPFIPGNESQGWASHLTSCTLWVGGKYVGLLLTECLDPLHEIRSTKPTLDGSHQREYAIGVLRSSVTAIIDYMTDLPDEV